MKFSSLTERTAGEGVDGWAVHYEAMRRLREGEDILLLSVGQETREFTPEPVQQAAIDAIRNGRHHYTPVEGEAALRAAIAKRHSDTTGQAVSADHVTVFSGAQNALFATTQCLLEHGDEVIVPEPYYATYPAVFTTSGATLVPLPCRAEDGFQVDVAALENAITERTQAVVLNSPNNPTGAVYERERLQAIVDLCRERGIWIISDEVYAEVATEQFTSVSSLPGANDITVTVSSLSKSHRMTGWRCGWAIAPLSLAKHFYNLNMCMCYGLPPFTQAAAITAIEQCHDSAAEIRDMLNRRRALMAQALENVPGIRFQAQGAGMFVVLDIRDLGMSGSDFAWGLLNQFKVAILPCDGFGPSGKGLMRISLCESDERLLLACEHLKNYVASL